MTPAYGRSRTLDRVCGHEVWVRKMSCWLINTVLYNSMAAGEFRWNSFGQTQFIHSSGHTITHQEQRSRKVYVPHVCQRDCFSLGDSTKIFHFCESFLSGEVDVCFRHVHKGLHFKWSFQDKTEQARGREPTVTLLMLAHTWKWVSIRDLTKAKITSMLCLCVLVNTFAFHISTDSVLFGLRSVIFESLINAANSNLWSSSRPEKPGRAFNYQRMRCLSFEPLEDIQQQAHPPSPFIAAGRNRASAHLSGEDVKRDDPGKASEPSFTCLYAITDFMSFLTAWLDTADLMSVCCSWTFWKTFHWAQLGFAKKIHAQHKSCFFFFFRR